MKELIFILISVGVLLGAQVVMAQNKVVVVPLGASGSQNKPVLGSYGGNPGSFSAGNTFFISSQIVNLPADGTCVVTAIGWVYHVDSGDDVRGPYFKSAYKEGSGSPQAFGVTGNYMLRIAGVVDSTISSVTNSFSVTANTDYSFGAVFMNPPANWQNDSPNLTVSWVCSVD